MSRTVGRYHRSCGQLRIPFSKLHGVQLCGKILSCCEGLPFSTVEQITFDSMESATNDKSTADIEMGCDSPRTPASIEKKLFEVQYKTTEIHSADQHPLSFTPVAKSPIDRLLKSPIEDYLQQQQNENDILNSYNNNFDNSKNNKERQDSIQSKSSSEDILSIEPRVKTDSGQTTKRKDRVVINVGGMRHITYRSTLRNVPDTRLSWLADSSAFHSADYDAETGEFFFDRHPAVFSHVLNYYRTGKLHVPYDVCGPLYEEELQYWGIDDSQVESCCWISYRQHRDAQDTLKDFEGIELDYDADDDSQPDLARYGFHVERENQISLTKYERWLLLKPKIWSLFEDPSSRTAKILAYLSMALILLSVMLFCLETMESFRNNKTKKEVVLILEGICVAWFTVELAIRFITCPSKCQFIKNIMNWIDLMAIVPYFVEIIVDKMTKTEHDSIMFLQVIRVIRVFRIIKLAKHNMGLQILGHTLKASIRELFLLIFFLFIGIIIFSSLVYYCEKDEPNTKFKSIPRAFWWAVITMTTVGYGDMAPTNDFGKVVGGLCAITGVLMIALPVPVIVNNFNLYYLHAQARLKLPKKKRKVLVNAANALKDAVDLELQQTQVTDDLENSVEEDQKANQCTVTISDDGKPCDLPPEEMDQGRLRLQKFGRRDSKLFGGTQTQNTDQQAGRLSLGNGGGGSINGANSYALQKRRSLLPGMSALPEIE